MSDPVELANTFENHQSVLGVKGNISTEYNFNFSTTDVGDILKKHHSFKR